MRRDRAPAAVRDTARDPIARFEAMDDACLQARAEDIQSLAALHPLRERALQALVDRSDGDWSAVEKLVSDGLRIPAEYDGNVGFRDVLHPAFTRNEF